MNTLRAAERLATQLVIDLHYLASTCTMEPAAARRIRVAADNISDAARVLRDAAVVMGSTGPETAPDDATLAVV